MDMVTAGVAAEGTARKGAAPSAVAMAVLGVEGALLCAVLFLVGLGVVAGARGRRGFRGFRRGPDCCSCSSCSPPPF